MNHTAGPWRWNFSSGSFSLETVGRGRLIVMDFVRMGMGSAQPRFAKWEGEDRGRLGGIMHKAADMGELHDHPDARLISYSPDLLASLKEMVQALKESSADRGLVAGHGDALDKALKLISEVERKEKVLS